MPGTNVNIGQITVNVNDIIPPDNFATVDAGTKIGSVYTKEQNNTWRKEVEQNTNAGIKGVAKPDDVINTTGFYRMLANIAETYTNYLDVNDASIVVTDADLNVVSGVQRNEVVIEVNNGISEKKVFAKVGADGANGTANIPQWTAGDYSPDAMVVHEFVQYITPVGAGATDIPGESDKWVQLGGKVENVFDEENETAGASMNATAHYINERFGVEIIPPSTSETYDQTDAPANNQYLGINNDLGIDASANNNYVLHNLPTNGANTLVLTGYINKDSSTGRVGVLGIKPDNSIVHLTASFGNYQLLDNQVFHISDYSKLSIAMAANFTAVLNTSGEYFPKITDYFLEKTGFGEIKNRRQDRYISDYRGVSVIQLGWEITELIRVESGDVVEATGFGWSVGSPVYSVFDTNKNWIKSGPNTSVNGGAYSVSFVSDREGYIMFSNYKVSGVMTVFLNKTKDLNVKFSEIDSKLKFTPTKKIDYKTPKSLASAKFFEPYIDGDVLKVKQPTNIKEKLVLNNEPEILENRFVGEHSFVYFKGQILVYYTEAIKTGQAIYDVRSQMSVGLIDEMTEKHTYLQPVISAGMLGVPAGYNVHRSCAFVKDNQVYIVATVENSSVSEIWMFKSSNGLDFSFVKKISNPGFGFNTFGNLWMVSEQQIGGYYYFFYEGNTTGNSTWRGKIARSTTIEGDWTYYQDLSGLGISGGMVGGFYVRYFNNKFRIFYHYGAEPGNLPTYLGYGESLDTNPGAASVIHQPLLAIENSPIGLGTDQNGDQALLEINGSIWWGYQYAINTPILNGVFCFKKLNGLTYNDLFV